MRQDDEEIDPEVLRFLSEMGGYTPEPLFEDLSLPLTEPCPGCGKEVIQIYESMFEGTDGCVYCLPTRRWDGEKKEWVLKNEQ